MWQSKVTGAWVPICNYSVTSFNEVSVHVDLQLGLIVTMEVSIHEDS